MRMQLNYFLLKEDNKSTFKLNVSFKLIPIKSSNNSYSLYTLCRMWMETLLNAEILF